jgi:hypothetical protein
MAKRGCSWLGVDRLGRRSSKRVNCDILSQSLNRIDRILVPQNYTFFSGSPTEKNSEVKHA